LSACAAIGLGSCAPSAQSQKFALKDGDTVVFYGDSITAQRLYTKYAEEFVLTRYPKLHLRFVNAGVPGDSVRGGYAGSIAERIQRDVVPFQPAMITVMLGMNDGGWGYGSSEIDSNFQTGYCALLNALRKAVPSAEITLILPSPYDEITHGTEFPGYSRVIDKFADDVSSIGSKLQASGDNTILLADFHHPLTNALERAKGEFPQLAPLIVPDRIHPAETGHWIMAAALMSAWHVNPVVSMLALDAASSKVIEKDQTTIEKLEKTADGLIWTQIDEALPLPFDFNNAMIPALLQISDIAKIDQMTLRIESLFQGQYVLSIDGKAVADFSSDELSKGVNLALYKTPMNEQARGLAGREDQRATLDQARFILAADAKQSETSALAEAKLWQAETDIDAAIRGNLTPVPHYFELRRK
jgi:lysophospholipase L1-like esterase